MLALSAIILIDLIGILVTAKSTTIVKTTTGPVQGEILQTALNSVEYATFKGIRYAEAPIGYLRFKPPVSVTPWTTTLNATIEGNSCPQFDSLTKTLVGSEDCLFLNIFTPMTNLSVAPKTLMPVMVYIHGGGFFSGSGSPDHQRPDYLLEKGIVYVSMNYRLGALGFLNLNHPNATGNAGLKDQNLALKWVRSNIAKFGGNSKNVTIFGISAGGASVSYHVISEASAGLFHGAISMSGVPLAPWAFQTSLKGLSLAQTLAKYLGTISTDKEILLKAYYKATAEQITTAAILMGQLKNCLPSIENSSIATDPFLTENPYWKYYTGNYNRVPQILGFLEQETLTFASFRFIFSEIIDVSLEEAQKIGIVLPKSLITTRDQIISDVDWNQMNKTTVQDVINITSAIYFISPSDRTQRLLAADDDGKPVYYYRISFYTNESTHIFPGAGHGDDGSYIFYLPNATNATDLTISRITTMWTNFAKYGHPTPDWIHDNSVGVYWPNSGPCGKTLDIGHKLIVGPRLITEDAELIGLLTWPNKKNRLLNSGLVRPIQQV